MKAVSASAQIIDMTSGVDVLKKIELVGRTCYKSTDRITEDSAENFVKRLIDNGHEAMLEHASFILELNPEAYYAFSLSIRMLRSTGFVSYLAFTQERRHIVSGNVRAWRDFFKACLKQFKRIDPMFHDFICENPVIFPFEVEENTTFRRVVQLSVGDLSTDMEILNHCYATVKFIVDRGVSHEIVRHRPASYAQESTRYCNYSIGKFGHEITCIIPSFLKYKSKEWTLWVDAMNSAEKTYLEMLEFGMSPQESRSVLPNSLKTELIMTASIKEWHHFFALRAAGVTGKPHPQMLEVAKPLLDDFNKIFLNRIFGDLV